MDSTCCFCWRRPIVCRFLAVTLVSLLSVPAGAGQLSLIVNGKALHFDTPAGQKFNEENWGAGFQYDFDAIGEDKHWVPFLAVSGFRDSMKNPSYYAGGGILRRYRFNESSLPVNLDVGAIAFLMTREDFHDNQPFPGILPVVSFGTDRVALNITYIPRVDPKMVPLVFFQLKIGLFGQVR
jgi:hypothetical protein